MSTSVRDYLEDLRRFESACEEFMQWSEAINSKLSPITVDVNFNEFSENIKKLREKRDKKTMDIPIVGTTSSGKSLLINSLIRLDLMVSAIGHTTPCAVSIQKTNESEASYQIKGTAKETFDLSSEDGIKSLRVYVDNVSKERPEDVIHVFLPTAVIRQDTILSRNVALIDSPGMERECFGKDETKKIIEKADAIVVLIDIVTGLNEDKTTELLEKSRFFVKPNVLILFNKCDKLQKEEESRRSKLIEQCLRVVTDFLKKDRKNYPADDDAKSTIFFVSAKEANKAWQSSEADLAASSRSGFGYTFNGTDYDTNAEARSLAFSSFKKKLIAIASDNFEQVKAARMRTAVEKNTEDLGVKAGEVYKRYQSVCDKINDLLLNEKAFYVKEEEGKRMATFLYDSQIREGPSSIPGKEKVSVFINYSKGDGSDSILDFYNRLCESVDPQLVTFVEETYNKVFDDVFRIAEEKYAEKFGRILDPVQYFDQDLTASEVKLEEFKRLQKAMNEEDDKRLREFMAEMRRREEQDHEEIELHRRNLTLRNDLVSVDLYRPPARQLMAPLVCQAVTAAAPTGADEWLVAALAATSAAVVDLCQIATYPGYERREQQAPIGIDLAAVKSRKEEERKLRKKTFEKQLETDKAKRDTEGKELELQCEKQKGEAEKRKLAILEETKIKHIEALMVIYVSLMREIQENVANSFRLKVKELARALSELQDLIDKHCGQVSA